MSLDNLDTGKFVPVQVPRNRFKVLYQYIARPKYHGLRRTRNTFENSRSLVQQKRRSTVIVQITKPLISIYAVYQISIHLSKSTRCRTINDVSSPVYNTFKSKCVCVCAYLKICDRTRPGSNVVGYSPCFHEARNISQMVFVTPFR